MDLESSALALSLPPEYRTLIACVRGALHDRPLPVDMAEPQWPLLDRRAREQGVDIFLFPWLAAHYPDGFPQSSASPDSVAGAWRMRALTELQRSTLRQRQIADLAAGFSQAGLDLALLKGAWLAESIYAGPALRSMSDIDVLIRDGQRDASHAVMLKLGYTASKSTLHSRFAYDQLYRHPQHAYAVEMHWAFSSERETDSPDVDMAAIWRHAGPTRLYGHPCFALSPPDQLAHLVHHMLHHLFAVPLRAYLDVALLIRARGNTLPTEDIAAAGVRWQTGAAIPFVLRFTAELFDLPLPAAWQTDVPQIDAIWRDAALHALAHLPRGAERGAESTFLSYRHASLMGRTRLVLKRIFMPRAFLAQHYPCARVRVGMPWAWICRARDLYRTHHATLAALDTDDSPEQRRLDAAAVRTSLARHLRQTP
ncbi:MAG TPA: nucleotidyltransferase family protein [Kiritimatiellia bacterium]|nr:nucleotidyltransferase family protein [Kiritimatiellia bacterium]HRU71429.1 nucleotidyltransferase family protein [Kiritimatiellia bacterium]